MAHLEPLMRRNFLEYASYVIVDRAIPDLRDGFKPVQRRILATLPARRQNLLFSATMPSEVRHLADRLLLRPTVVELSHSAPASTVDHALVSVADTGGGIPEEHLDRVFEAGFRGDAARTPGTGGAGLGLAIARALVAAHHGDITVTNDGAGARFVVRLPVDGRNGVGAPG